MDANLASRMSRAKSSRIPDVAKKANLRDPDARQKVINMCILALEGYKATVSCCLAIFVPLRCTTSCNGVVLDRICDVKENLNTNDPFEKFVLIFNFLSLFMLLIHYWCMYKRENFLVEFLDYDGREPDDGLKEIIGLFPKIDSNMKSWNRWVFLTAAVSLLMLILNALVSGKLVFDAAHYTGFRTATTFLTNNLLMIFVLKNCFVNCFKGIYYDAAISCLNQEFATYNVIDVDHMKDKGAA